MLSNNLSCYLTNEIELDLFDFNDSFVSYCGYGDIYVKFDICLN